MDSNEKKPETAVPSTEEQTTPGSPELKQVVDAIASKIASAPVLEFIDGTESKKDYLVVGKLGGFVVGLKIDGAWAVPLPIAQFVARIRVEAIDPNMLVTDKLFEDTFPQNAGWTGASDKHRSYSDVAQIAGSTVEELLTSFSKDDLFSTTLATLKALLPNGMAHDDATIEGWVLGRVKETATKYKTVMDKVLAAKKQGKPSPFANLPINQMAPALPDGEDQDEDSDAVSEVMGDDSHPNVTVLLPKGTKPTTH